MPEENKCLILTFQQVLKQRYRVYAQKCKPLLHFPESLKRDDTEIFSLWREESFIISSLNGL